jgi:uncharacterized membrane protein
VRVVVVVEFVVVVVVVLLTRQIVHTKQSSPQAHTSQRDARTRTIEAARIAQTDIRQKQDQAIT